MLNVQCSLFGAYNAHPNLFGTTNGGWSLTSFSKDYFSFENFIDIDTKLTVYCAHSVRGLNGINNINFSSFTFVFCIGIIAFQLLPFSVFVFFIK